MKTRSPSLMFSFGVRVGTGAGDRLAAVIFRGAALLEVARERDVAGLAAIVAPSASLRIAGCPNESGTPTLY